MEVVAAAGSGRLVSARYPLERFEEAVAHAGAAGRRGAVKIVFDLEAPSPPRPPGLHARQARRERTHPMSPRPGFVLEVDRSTPPTLFWHGEGFPLERLPTGSRVIYGPEPLDPLADPVGAIRHALTHPLGDAEPLPALLRPGMRLTIAFDDVSLPLPPDAPARRPPAGDRAGPRPGGRGRAWTTSSSSPPWPCTGG